MSKWNGVNEVLDFAIEKEQEAADFYTELASKVDKPWMQKTFSDFAKEELGHKAKLEAVKSGKKMLQAEQKVQDLKVGDYLVEVEASPELDYQATLVLAMQREKAAFRLYSDLAREVDDAEVREVFLGLAQEEAKHKLRFEIEYDDNVLTEN